MRSRWELMTYLSVSAVLILKESPKNKAHVLNSSPRLTQIGRNTLVLFQRSFTNSGGSTLTNFIRAWPNFILFYFYRPQRSCEGCFYTCLSVHGGVCFSACWDTPETRHPRADTPPDQAPPRQTATVADGMHPTGMHSCILFGFFGSAVGSFIYNETMISTFCRPQWSVCHSVHREDVCHTPPGRHPPRIDTPLHSACWDTVNKQVVCILLKCILFVELFQ